MILTLPLSREGAVVGITMLNFFQYYPLRSAEVGVDWARVGIQAHL
jgi:hypothetical protein